MGTVRDLHIGIRISGEASDHGAAITSPYVTMSQNYLKQVNQCWYQIYQIVKENCSVEYGGASPHDDLMERLLSARKK